MFALTASTELCNILKFSKRKEIKEKGKDVVIHKKPFQPHLSFRTPLGKQKMPGESLGHKKAGSLNTIVSSSIRRTMDLLC